MNPSTACARVLLDELVRLGVRDVVLCPGSRSAPLAYAAHELDAAGSLRLHVRVDERSAAFLALGLGKRTRRPAVVVTTSGSAVANLHPAVVEAHHAAVPMLLVTADRPPELRGVGANQATDQPGLLGGQVRLLLDLETPADPERQAVVWRTSAARAWAAATGALGGAPGPVHLNLPLRDPLAPEQGEGGAAASTLSGALAGRPGGRPWVELPQASATDVTGADRARRAGWAAEPLPHDARTLVVIGELPTPEHRRAALDWAAHRGAPVMAEPGPGSSAEVLPHGSLVVGDLDWVRTHLPHRVVVVGRPTLGRAVPALTREPCVRVDVVTPDEPAASGWADATHTAAAVHPFAAFAVTGEPREPSGWARAWWAAGERVAAALADQSATGPLDGPAVATTLHAALPTGSRLLLGSSSPARDLHLAVARPREDLDVVTSRGLAGIDGLVSTAAGLALAGDAPTYALLGDLTFLHDGNGLLRGPDEPEPDLTVVVVDDDGGSIFDTLEYGAPGLAAPFTRLFATPTRTDVVALARAHGVPADEVSGSDELAAAVAGPPQGLRVVVVRVDLASRRASDEQRRALAAQALRS